MPQLYRFVRRTSSGTLFWDNVRKVWTDNAREASRYRRCPTGNTGEAGILGDFEPIPTRLPGRGRTPYVVTDTKGRTPAGTFPILGRFRTADDASRFIGTLPEHATGRYGLDGPADDA